MKKIAMIFAAGLGTRLYPITLDKPKALAEVNGITLLENAIAYLSKFGFNDFVINTHHFAEKIENYIRNSHFKGINIHISYEEKLLDTAGGLALAAKYFHADDLILLYNVDIVTQLNLNLFIDDFIRSNSDISLAVQSRNTSRYFLFGTKMRLFGWKNIKTGEKIVSTSIDIISLKALAFNGIHLIKPTVVDQIGKPIKKSLTPFYLEQMQNLIISGFKISDDEVWFDCGKVESLNAASSYLVGYSSTY